MIEGLIIAACTLFNPPAPPSFFLSLPRGEESRALPDEDEQEDGEKVKQPVYPKLSALHKQKVKRLFTSFKNRNPAKRKQHEKEMISIGRGAVPALLENADTKHEAQGVCIYHCLLALMDEQDVVVLKKCYTSKNERKRRLAVVKMASFKNEKHRKFLKEALKDEDPDIRLEAALGLVNLKDASGIGEIILKIAENRKHPPKNLVEPLPILKGHVYGSHFTLYLLSHENPDVRITTAEVIALIGDVRLKSTLGKALRDPHNLVQTAAVNALRKLVNNDEPLQFKNIFELVEEVNKWKKDLGIAR